MATVSNRYFISPDPLPRRRRAGDAFVVVVGTALVLLGASTRFSDSRLHEGLLVLSDALPSWSSGVAESVYALGSLYALALLGAIIARGRKSLDVLRDALLAIAVTTLLAMWLARVVEGEWAQPWRAMLWGDAAEGYPLARLAIVSTVVAVIAPHLTLPVRRAGWIVVAAVAWAGFHLGFGSLGDVVGGFGIGVVSASVVLLVFGSPLGFPDIPSVRSALKSFGLEVDACRVRNDDSWGVRIVDCELPDGSGLTVKVLGRDAVGSLTSWRFWRRLWYRPSSFGPASTRIGAVEHEAVMAMLAAQSGVRSPLVRAIGLAGDDLVILAVDRPGLSLNSAPSSALDDATLGCIWEQLAVLHEHSIVHGSVDGSAVRIDGAEVYLTGFHSASVMSEQGDAGAANDIAQTLYLLCELVGTDRAVRSALAGVDRERLLGALTYLQLPALPRSRQTDAGTREPGNPKALVKDARVALADALDVEPPPVAELRRVSWQSVGMLALILVAVNALVGMLAGLDFAAVWEVVQTATWGWIIVGAVVGQAVFLPQATGMLFAVGHHLPLKPLVVLQVAIKFIGLAVPSTAGRVAMNAAFLRNYGVSMTIAMTQGAVDGIAGFVVEIAILLLALFASDVQIDLSGSGVSWPLIIAIAVLLVGGAIATILRVRRLREPVLRALAEAGGLAREVLRDPRRAAGLLGSNFGSRLILGISMWFILEGLGSPVSLGVALTATVGTNLLAGLVPIPGGIGVAEATLTALLVLIGLPQDVAFAAAVVFRVATFYLPAVAGYFATAWLRNRDYL